MKYKITKKLIFLLIVLIIPILFIGVLKLYYLIIPGEEIGEIGDWIGFSGGYIGALVALGGIYFQILEDKKNKEIEEKKHLLKQKQNILKYLEFNLNKNKEFFSENNYGNILDCTSFGFLKHESFPKVYSLNSDYIQNNINSILSLEIIGYKIIDFDFEINDFIISYSYLVRNLQTKKILLENIQEYLKNMLTSTENEYVGNGQFFFHKLSIQDILFQVSIIKSICYSLEDCNFFINKGLIPEIFVKLKENENNEKFINKLDQHLKNKDDLSFYLEIKIYILNILKEVLYFIAIDSNLYAQLKEIINHFEKIFEVLIKMFDNYRDLEILIPKELKNIKKYL